MVPSSVSTYDLDPYILALPPFRSSIEAGWKGLMLRTYRGPAEVESMIVLAVPDASLVMLTQGALGFESRSLGEEWEAIHVGVGDWFLTPGGGAPYEVRWHKTSAEDLHILNLHVDATLLSHAAEQLADHLPARIELLERSGFQDPSADPNRAGIATGTARPNLGGQTLCRNRCTNACGSPVAALSDHRSLHQRLFS